MPGRADLARWAPTQRGGEDRPPTGRPGPLRPRQRALLVGYRGDGPGAGDQRLPAAGGALGHRRGHRQRHRVGIVGPGRRRGPHHRSDAAARPLLEPFHRQPMVGDDRLRQAPVLAQRPSGRARRRGVPSRRGPPGSRRGQLARYGRPAPRPGHGSLGPGRRGAGPSHPGGGVRRPGRRPAAVDAAGDRRRAPPGHGRPAGRDTAALRALASRARRSPPWPNDHDRHTAQPKPQRPKPQRPTRQRGRASMDLGFAGARAAVTGGTKGMGRAIALRLAGEGAQVAVLARHQAELDETVGALRAAGAPDAMGWATDVTDPSSVTAAFDAIGSRWDSLNVLVNTVGPGAAKFEDLADDDWDAVFEIGLMSAVRSTRAALPLLRAAEWARIVNISAHSIQRQSPLLVAYTASKA